MARRHSMYIYHSLSVLSYVTAFFLGGTAHALSTPTPKNQQQQQQQQKQQHNQLRFFIGGLGYCGSRLAERLRREFPSCEISGCVRSCGSQRSKQIAMNRIDCRVHVLDVDQNYVGLDGGGQRALSQATHIIQTIAPIADFDRDPFLTLHRDILLPSSSHSTTTNTTTTTTAAAAASPSSSSSSSSSPSSSTNLQWVGYISSTGVYGDHQGAWVDEGSSELKCQDAKSLARVRAEQEWRELEQESVKQTGTNTIRVDCFRCGGIYGPGRGPLFSIGNGGSSKSSRDDLDSTTNNGDDPPKYVNRILVDDICAAMVAVIRKTLSQDVDGPNDGSSPPAGSANTVGSVYNLVDDDPSPRRDVVKCAQQILLQASSSSSSSDNELNEVSSTTKMEPRPSSSTRRSTTTSRNTGNKRCRNDKFKRDFPEWESLRIAPTYREGLQYLYKQQQEQQQEQQQQQFQ